MCVTSVYATRVSVAAAACYFVYVHTRARALFLPDSHTCLVRCVTPTTTNAHLCQWCSNFCSMKRNRNFKKYEKYENFDGYHGVCINPTSHTTHFSSRNRRSANTTAVLARMSGSF